MSGLEIFILLDRNFKKGNKVGCLAQYFTAGGITAPVRPEAYIAQPRDVPDPI